LGSSEYMGEYAKFVQHTNLQYHWPILCRPFIYIKLVMSCMPPDPLGLEQDSFSPVSCRDHYISIDRVVEGVEVVVSSYVVDPSDESLIVTGMEC